MTTPHNQPEPTELEKAIATLDELLTNPQIPKGAIIFGEYYIVKSAALRTQQVKQQLTDITDVAKKLAENGHKCLILSLMRSEPYIPDYVRSQVEEILQSSETLAKQAKLL